MNVIGSKNINFLGQQKLDFGKNSSHLKKDTPYCRWSKQTDKNKEKKYRESCLTEIAYQNRVPKKY